MERMSREEFVERFPLVVPAYVVRGIHKDAVVIDRNAMFGGLAEGDVIIRAGARVIGHGIITGNLTVEDNAVLYYDGIVKGKVSVRGAACLMGIFESFEAIEGACVSIAEDSKVGDR